jgi:hypothetical protein
VGCSSQGVWVGGWGCGADGEEGVLGMVAFLWRVVGTG